MVPNAHGSAQAWSVRLWRAMLVGLGLSASAQIVVAQGTSETATVVEHRRAEFDIPAQPMERALDRFGAIAGFQVFYETALTSGRRSQSVKGVFDPINALRLLLQGSGLTARVIAANTITIMPDSGIDTDLRRGKQAALANYGVMQAAITAALCRNIETRPGSYRMVMQYWIDSSGRISRVRLIGSSGNEARDNSIVRSLQTVVLPRSHMPQPVTLAMEPSEHGAVPACGPTDVETTRVR